VAVESVTILKCHRYN